MVSPEFIIKSYSNPVIGLINWWRISFLEFKNKLLKVYFKWMSDIPNFEYRGRLFFFNFKLRRHWTLITCLAFMGIASGSVMKIYQTDLFGFNFFWGIFVVADLQK